MRKLNTQQKKLIKKWFVKYEIDCYEDLDYEQIERLEKINDFETLYQEVNGFMRDLY